MTINSNAYPYQLDIISQNTTLSNKAYKKYLIDGQETIGVYDGEAFKVKFTNNSFNNVQLKLSIDGVTLFDGTNKISVGPNGHVELNAWPETTKSGAQLVFTIEENGVYNYVPAEKLNRGLIIAQVFVEEVEYNWTYAPVTITIPTTTPTINPTTPYYVSGPIWLVDYTNPSVTWSTSTATSTAGNLTINNGGMYTVTCTGAGGGGGGGSGAVSNTINSNVSGAGGSGGTNTSSYSPTPVAVGAGETVNQNIPIADNKSTVKTRFDKVLSVKYIYWDQLLPMIYKANVVGLNPGEHALMNIGKTPRLTDKQPIYERLC